jgi:hypothetical protein
MDHPEETRYWPRCRSMPEARNRSAAEVARMKTLLRHNHPES